LFSLYNSLRLFYANGGGPCYIVSVGSYEDKLSQEALLRGLEVALTRARDTATAKWGLPIGWPASGWRWPLAEIARHLRSSRVRR